MPHWACRQENDHLHRGMLAALVTVAFLLAPVTLADEPTKPEDPGAPPAVTASELYKPTRMPDRIVLTWEDDPTTTQAVTWRTSSEVEAAFAEIAPAAKGGYVKETKRLGFDEHLQRVPAETTFFKNNLHDCHIHVARFAGLKPETRYAYRVGDGTNWSEWFQFQTASTRPRRFSFIYFGDSQNHLRPMWPWVVREAMRTAPQAAFTLHGGDLTSGRGNDEEWGDWHYSMSWVNAMVPFVGTPGNHDYMSRKESDDTKVRFPEPHWRAQFTLPRNGPEGLEETAYYLDYQGTRIISLDSNDKLEAQVPWIEKVLSENPNAWTIITFHHPVFATAQGRKSTTRAIWKPVFDRHNVDLVLTGHDHAYSRTGLVSGEDTDGSSRRGTIYVVSFSGPKPYRIGPADGEPREQFVRLGEDMQLFQVISIDGAVLRYESRTAAGELYDIFEIRKHPDGTKELLDPGREMPSRLRATTE